MPELISGRLSRFLRLKFRVLPWHRKRMTNSPLTMKSVNMSKNWVLNNEIRLIFCVELKKLGVRPLNELLFWQLGFVKFLCSSDVIFSLRKKKIVVGSFKVSNQLFMWLRVPSDLASRQTQCKIAVEPENRPWSSKTAIFAAFRKHDFRPFYRDQVFRNLPWPQMTGQKASMDTSDEIHEPLADFRRTWGVSELVWLSGLRETPKSSFDFDLNSVFWT